MAKRSKTTSNRTGSDRAGRNLLHNAAADADAKAVIKLIDAGVEIDAQDTNQWTPLHFAAQSSCSEAIAALIQAGADVTLQDSYGNTALWRAVFAYRGVGDSIRLLLGAGADPHTANHSGVSPISLAQSIANNDVAKYLNPKASESDDA
jgi:ankyrin repeat protein